MANGTTIESSVQEPELPPDQIIDDADSGGDAETEIRARDMGWKPLSEYRGPPGKWQPAKEFIERGENILPIVRDQNRRLTERVGKLETEISGLRSTSQEQLQIIKDLRDMGARADQRGYERAMDEIKNKQRQAVSAGDTEAYDQLVEQAEALAESRAAARPSEPKPAEPPKPQPPQLSEATRAFVATNPWFNSDPFLTRKMIDQHIDVIQEGRLTEEAEQFAEAKRRLQEDYPERFGLPPTPRPPQQQRRRGSSVSAPTPPPPVDPPDRQRQAIASIADPAERAEARTAFDRMKRQLPDYTEAEYMRLYNEPHSDVLEAQNAARKK